MDAQLHISVDEQVINPVCEFAYSWCRNCGMGKKDAERFTVAVSELISNIIQFAYPRESRHGIDLRFRHTLTEVELVVSEVGEPFDPDRHRYDPRRALEIDQFEGAGLRLMRAFTDECLFVNKGKEGKEFHLSKRLPVSELDTVLERSRILKPAPPREPDEGKTAGDEAREAWTVERVRAEDAEDVAKLIYRTYEYSYTKEDLYFPKKIEQSLLAKEKLGVIARLKSGEAIGYFAVLRKKDSNIAEVGEAVVSPQHRRRGVMSAMMERLIEEARRQRLHGLFGKAVTIHPVSQRVNHKYDFVSTALLLAETSSKVVYKGFDEQYPQPVSVVVDFLPLAEWSPKKVFLPAPYTEMLLETYRQLRVPIEQATPKEGRMAPRSEIELIINYSYATSLIVVHKYGPDFQEVLGDMLESLEGQEKRNATYMDLPLENPLTPAQFPHIVSLGFIYSGLVPLFHRDADYLRMQKIYKPLDLELVEVYSDFGKEIKKRIADEYRRHT
ncbi:MAG: GNAT family N-acetyltransferase [Balneolaceae bacterium]|nr:GNAT family N-acetyltransferase [Balneolaceae bacterium]